MVEQYLEFTMGYTTTRGYRMIYCQDTSGKFQLTWKKKRQLPTITTSLETGHEILRPPTNMCLGTNRTGDSTKHNKTTWGMGASRWQFNLKN